MWNATFHSQVCHQQAQLGFTDPFFFKIKIEQNVHFNAPLEIPMTEKYPSELIHSAIFKVGEIVSITQHPLVPELKTAMVSLGPEKALKKTVNNWMENGHLNQKVIVLSNPTIFYVANYRSNCEIIVAKTTNTCTLFELPEGAVVGDTINIRNLGPASDTKKVQKRVGFRKLLVYLNIRDCTLRFKDFPFYIEHKGSISIPIEMENENCDFPRDYLDHGTSAPEYDYADNSD